PRTPGRRRPHASSTCTTSLRYDTPARSVCGIPAPHRYPSGGPVRLIIWSLTAALAASWCPSSGDDAASAPDAVNRFLARADPPLASAVALRHLEATTRGGAMSGWIDACTALENGALRYWIVGEGGSGAVRKRALVAALDGEVTAQRDGRASRARLDPQNYD